MGRILAIDYGITRVGIAVTDPLKIIATPLITVRTVDVLTFLQAYMQQEKVDTLVVGLPKRLNNTSTSVTKMTLKFIKKLQKAFPKKYIVTQDERYTSKIALASMVAGGFKQKDRRNKANLDKVSATILLQSFLANPLISCIL
mmetsp:Transcript_4357/g.9845  ORF Transcript_4357/g.9845 Transcript_4357/m.9845 type:complete len:143 (-) Transcript_4357:17-445(-)